MSLIPSESASFPDLVGQVHGYRHPKARRPSLRRKATRLTPNDPENELEPAPRLESSDLVESPEDNRDVFETSAFPSSPPPPEAEAERVELEPLPWLESSEPPESPEDNRDVFETSAPPSSLPPPEAEAERVQLEPFPRLESSEPPESPEDNRGVFETSAPPSCPRPPESPAQPDRVELEPLTPLDPPEPRENPDHNRSAVETATSPAPPPQKPGMDPTEAAFQLELRLPFISRNVENSYLVHAPLPVPRQRSVAQMRSKIQPQETAPSVPANRPRTPVRGLTINRPAPIVVEKPARRLSARFPLLNLPRHRLIKFIRFIVCETLAVGVLVLAMIFGFAHQLANDPLSFVLKVLAIVAAVAAIMLPVIFYGLPEIFARSQR